MTSAKYGPGPVMWNYFGMGLTILSKNNLKRTNRPSSTENTETIYNKWFC